MQVMEPLLMHASRVQAAPGLDEWAAGVGRALDGGTRLLSLFGRAEGEIDVLTTAILQGADGSLSVLRGRGRRDGTYAALTVQHPAAQIFERELWEQTGLTPAGHPWLKPVRYEGLRQGHMNEHPFFTVRGPQVHEVGVGPIHASVIEPGHFRFMCHGETVHHLEIQLGYQHRGVEAMLLRRAPLALAPLIETSAGDSSVAYAWSYCAAVEALAGRQISAAADTVRAVALELERIAMHLVTLTGLATDIAFLQGGTSYGRLRTAIINATMRVCGSRFGRGWLRPGGVRFAITEPLRRDLLATLAAFASDMGEVNALMLGSRSVGSRLHGIGVVSREAARDIGLTGLVARASGVEGDIRSSLPGAAYSHWPIHALTEDSGDCWARMRLRMREIDESVRWLMQVLERSDLAAAAVESSWPSGTARLRSDSLCVSVREGVRGPVVQALETGADGRLLHCKLQDPSLANWFGLALSMRNNVISDFPICNKSFDLSYCGNDL
jgi:Ni,Fe-hydrogenase III large subunit